MAGFGHAPLEAQVHGLQLLLERLQVATRAQIKRRRWTSLRNQVSRIVSAHTSKLDSNLCASAGLRARDREFCAVFGGRVDRDFLRKQVVASKPFKKQPHQSAASTKAAHTHPRLTLTSSPLNPSPLTSCARSLHCAAIKYRCTHLVEDDSQPGGRLHAAHAAKQSDACRERASACRTPATTASRQWP